MGASEGYRSLAEAAWAWVLGQVRDDDGPWLPVSVGVGEPTGAPDPAPGPYRDCLYDGVAGLAPVLAEIGLHRSLSDAEARLADAIVARLSRLAETATESGLYEGLAGQVAALRMLAPGTETGSLSRIAELQAPDGWPTTTGPTGVPLTDVIGGSAGIVMTAVWSGSDLSARVATAGGDALLAAADRTPAGLDWGMVPGSPSRGPNFSHGTAGVSAALAVAGTALDRADFVAAAVLGAQHLLDVGSLDDGGFVVPHTIPPARRDVEPLTYTWCHGPAGTSQLFAALARAGVEEVGGLTVDDLRERCLHAVLTSGVPQRLRPGFWDNDGRCCGTAGVGDVLLDAAQDDDDPARAGRWLAGTVTMADALVERALRDGDSAYWRFIEYRDDPPLLAPGTSWMQGAAGIAAYLFRIARVLDEGLTAPVVDRPDEWWAVPDALRTVGTVRPALDGAGTR
ncbi:MAG TPA: lanthionine synthetase LanC family protein [Actinomycetes bacterium]|nr:lanthionine synthetase LanC family protein [Actinomycetes bacterium]